MSEPTTPVVVYRLGMATVDCDVLRCTAEVPHFLPWPLGKRPLPICPFDATQTVMEAADSWSVVRVYNDIQAHFAAAQSAEAK